MRQPDCVGALIRDRENRVYIQRRSMQRKLLPGVWDIVGGRVEESETAEDALAREVAEETGWQLRRIEGVIADWEWDYNGMTHRELDYLVEVNGDLRTPRLEAGKHDRFHWVGFGDSKFIQEGYASSNASLWAIIARAARLRLTSRLRLDPVNKQSGGALWQVYAHGATALDDSVPAWDSMAEIAEDYGRQWDTDQGYHWLAYSRDAQRQLIGYGGLERQNISGVPQLVLRCAMPRDAKSEVSAKEIAKAMLAFARNDLRAERVTAAIVPSNLWAKDVLQCSGMKPAAKLISGSRCYEQYDINFPDESAYNLDQEVVTGIGQILAVPPG